MCGPPWSCARGAGPRLAAGPVSRVTAVTGNPPTTYQPPPDRRCGVAPTHGSVEIPRLPPNVRRWRCAKGHVTGSCSMGDGWSLRASRARRSWDSSERRSRPGPCRRRAGPTIIRPQGSRTDRTGTTPWSRRSGNHAAPRRTPRGRPGRRNPTPGVDGYINYHPYIDRDVSWNIRNHISADLKEQALYPGIGGYNCRYVEGTTSWSVHAFGAAIDINWQRNPRGSSTWNGVGADGHNYDEVPPQALEGRLPGPQLLLGPQLQHDPRPHAFPVRDGLLRRQHASEGSTHRGGAHRESHGGVRGRGSQPGLAALGV